MVGVGIKTAMPFRIASLNILQRGGERLAGCLPNKDRIRMRDHRSKRLVAFRGIAQTISRDSILSHEKTCTGDDGRYTCLGNDRMVGGRTNATAGRILGVIRDRDATPFQTVACKGKDNHCPHGSRWVCGPYGQRCWCTPC